MTLPSKLSRARPVHALRPASGRAPLRRLLSIALLSIWAAGALPAYAQDTPSPGDQGSDFGQMPEETKNLPNVALTGSILYQVVAAEVAMQRNQPAPAYGTYLKLARDTHDPRMAQRATEIALTAQAPADALISADLWRKLAPESVQAAQADSALLVLAGKPLEAEPLLAQQLATVTGDNRGPAILSLQALLGRSENRSEALAVLKDLLKNDLDRPQAQVAIARQQLLNDDTAGAAASLEAALKIKPDYLPAALMLSQMGPDERAKGIATFEHFTAEHPKSREGHLALAQLYLADSRFDDAQKQFEAMHSNDAKDATPLLALALLKLQQKQSDAAATYMKQYIDVAKQTPGADVSEAYVYLAQIALDQNQPSQAEQWLDKVDPSSRRYLPAQIMRSELLQREGKTEEARRTLTKLHPDSPRESALVARADAAVLFGAKRFPEAAARLAQAVQEVPDDGDLRYDYAMVSERTGDYPTMESQLRALIHLQPDNAEAYNALGYSLADRNERLPEAEKLIQKANELQPGDAYIMDSLGWVKYREGDTPGALKLLRHAYELQPNAEIGAHLGEVLWKTGSQDAARDTWRSAQKLEPDNETLQATLHRFQIDKL